nr:MAG TPA: hypothetical protein [Caudoviricetes sp.]
MVFRRRLKSNILHLSLLCKTLSASFVVNRLASL